MGFREGGGQIDPPPSSVYWFSSTPAGIGLKNPYIKWEKHILPKDVKIVSLFCKGFHFKVSDWLDIIDELRVQYCTDIILKIHFRFMTRLYSV